MDRIYVNFELKREEYLDAVVGGSRTFRSLSPKFYLILYSLIFAMFFSDHTFKDVDAPRWLSAGIAALAFMILVAGLPAILTSLSTPLLRQQYEKQFMESGQADLVRGYIFQGDGWTQIFQGQTLELEWSQIRNWKESDLSIIVSTGMPEIPIPKRVCTEEQQKALKELLHRKVGPPKLYLF